MKTLRIAGVMVVGLAVSAQALTMVLDDFDEPLGGQGVTLLNGVDGSSGTATSLGLSVLGGTRSMSLQIQDALAGGNHASITANDETSPGNLQLASSVLVDVYATVSYNAAGDGLGVDMSAWDTIGFGRVVLDAAPVTLSVTLTSATGSLTRNIALPGYHTGDVSLALDSFMSSSTPDLTSIQSMRVDIDPERGGDFLLGSVSFSSSRPIGTVVPDGGGTVGIMGLSMLAMFWYGRRQHTT